MIFDKLKQEIKIRGYSPKTKNAYLYHNQRFLSYIKKSPEQVTNQDIRNYLEYLFDKKQARETIRLAYSALHFYYTQIKNKSLMQNIKLPKKQKKMVIVLTKKEISDLIDSIKNPKHKLLIEFMYASGLRVSEVIKFKFKDILLDEKIGIVRGGKGNKDRKVILSDKFLRDIKQDSFQQPEDYLFPGRKDHLTIRSVQMILKQTAKKVGIKKQIYPHLLRHSFATHLVQNKVKEKYIQKIMGHKSNKTTKGYFHLSDHDIKTVKSPWD